MKLEEILPRFLEEPGGHVVLDAQTLTIVEVGPEYLRLTQSRREDLIGKRYVDTFTEPNPKRRALVESTVASSLAAAIKTHQTQKADVIRSDVVSGLDGKRIEKWWKAADIPVVVEDEVKWVVRRLEDVSTEYITYRKIHAQRISNYILYSLVILVVGLVAITQSGYAHDNRNLLVATCKQVQTINRNLYHSIRRQYVGTYTPGNSIYKFYHEHPDLRATAIIEDLKDLRAFAPTNC